MRKCEISGKGVISGHNITFSHKMNKRNWKPNLQPTKIVLGEKSLKVKVCSKVLKTLKGSTEAEVLNVLKKNEKTLSPRIQKFLAK